ncbi:MAG: N-formylglutamate amidohydrolase [Methanomicrobiales archaeon]|nr:N-formylglutamate amidohydrolase [Methanomicrobiales archaeon]
MTRTFPFLISIPHGGTGVPDIIRDEFVLSEQDLTYYADPATVDLFDFQNTVAASMHSSISRMVVDLNRPPYPLPPRNPDGIVKRRTVDGHVVYMHGGLPPITAIHHLLMDHYFPYHAELDRLIETRSIAIAFDCHSMLPASPPMKKEPGKLRPLICLGNSGDVRGRPRKGRLVTCPPGWMEILAESFRDIFGLSKEVTINTPFTGGFITNAHYWHKGVPWVQIEINRSLYEKGDLSMPGKAVPDHLRITEIRKKIRLSLEMFWDTVGQSEINQSKTLAEDSRQ